MDAFKAQGDEFYFTLYWHPDSCETFRKKIPSSLGWVGFEYGLWEKVPETEKLALLEELGVELDRMDDEMQSKWWTRHNDWQLMHSQLKLLAMFFGSDAGDEAFIEFAFQDPTLRPGFQWILDSRGPEFDPKHVASTLAAGETVNVFPRLTSHLMNVSEKHRLECFSRMLAKIAEKKPAKAE